MIAREMNQATADAVNGETSNHDDWPAGYTSPAYLDDGQAHRDNHMYYPEQSILFFQIDVIREVAQDDERRRAYE
jgi:hypothetical protein